MAEFSLGFTEGSFLQLNDQKHLRSIAEDLICNKQKRTKRIYQKRLRYGRHKTLKPIFLNRSLSDSYSACENKYHVMTTSSESELIGFSLQFSGKTSVILNWRIICDSLMGRFLRRRLPKFTK